MSGEKNITKTSSVDKKKAMEKKRKESQRTNKTQIGIITGSLDTSMADEPVYIGVMPVKCRLSSITINIGNIDLPAANIIVSRTKGDVVEDTKFKVETGLTQVESKISVEAGAVLSVHIKNGIELNAKDVCFSAIVINN